MTRNLKKKELGILNQYVHETSLQKFWKYQELYQICMINPSVNNRAANSDLEFISESDPVVCHNIMLNRVTLGNKNSYIYS